MSFLKFHFLLSTVLLTTNFNSNIGNTILANPYHGLNTITNNIQTDGIIVMDDVIMAVTTNNYFNTIEQVMISDQNQKIVFQNNGCGDNSCSFNLSNLQVGIYTVVVHTSNGELFTGQIQR